jgi:hypothetical protein
MRTFRNCEGHETVATSETTPKRHLLVSREEVFVLCFGRCLALGLLMATVIWSASVRASAAIGLCPSQEAVVFSCEVDRKVVSVCNDSGDQLSYRFGTPRKLELEIPSPVRQTEASVSGASITLSGGGGAYLRFSTGKFGYVVFTAISSSWGEKSGVVVERPGKKRIFLPCTSDPLSKIGPEFFQARHVPAATDFELP